MIIKLVDLDFADDTALLSRTIRPDAEKSGQYKQLGNINRTKINVAKIKAKYLNVKNNQPLTIKGKGVEDFDTLTTWVQQDAAQVQI